MIILPSIDIINGNCVRLKQGDFAQQTTYNATPAMMAKFFKQEGAKAMHVVDLQGAKNGKLMQLDVIASIVEAFGEGVQAGGGVRTREDVDLLLASGVNRVVIGTRAVTQQHDTSVWLNDYGIDRLVFALDFRLKDSIPCLATSGWQADSQLTLWELLDNLPDFSHVLCTDIGQDGMQKGPNLTMYEFCVQQYPRIHFQASGGIGRLTDIRALNALGLSAAIIGKALYEEKLLLSEAISCLNAA